MGDIKPNYYHKNGTDVIKMIEELRSKEASKEFCVGNVLKYVIRYDKKNGVEDLEKAKTYINRLILLESEGNEHGKGKIE